MTLFARFFLGVFLSVLVALATLVVVSRVSLEKGVQRFVASQYERQGTTLAEQLGQIYAEQGNWSAFTGQPQRWRQWLRSRARGSVWARRGPGVGPQGLRSMIERTYLKDAAGAPIAGPPPDSGQPAVEVDIRVEETVVGRVGLVLPPRQNRLPEERLLQSEQGRVLLTAALATLLIAGFAAWILARGVTRPLANTGQTLRRLARGDYEARAPLEGGRESREISGHVNALAETLLKNRGLRQEWMRDLAHELRTPLAIIRAESEALAEGVRAPDPAALASLAEEVAHLSGLLDDMQALALSDAGALDYTFEDLELTPWLERLIGEYRPRMADAGIELSLAGHDGVVVAADPGRLRQLFHNLLSNTERYTQSPGRCEVRVRVRGKTAEVTVADSNPGVASEDLERLFERFYRPDAGRSRAAGGAGLGLAIARRIAQGHQGDLTAWASDLGGLRMTLTLPVSAP